MCVVLSESAHVPLQLLPADEFPEPHMADTALTAGMTCANIDMPDPTPKLPALPRLVLALRRWWRG